MQQAPTRRDTVIDVIRGFAILSMVVAHIAPGSLLNKVVHIPLWVDGATLFVLLAGLVLGMIQNRAPSARAGTMKLVRRGRLIWLTHIGIALGAVTVASLTPSPEAAPTYAGLGGFLPAVWFVGTLRVNPPDADILSMYVLLFVVAVPAVLLLRAGKVWMLAGLSAVVYAVGFVFPGAATLPQYPGGPDGIFNVATWQALFMSGLVVGWYWQRQCIGGRLQSPKVVAVTCAGVVVVVALANLQRFDMLDRVPAVAAAVEVVFGKDTFGPGRLLVGWLAFTALYGLLHLISGSRVYGLVSVVFLRVGQRSLDSFVILAVFVIVMYFVPLDGASGASAAFSLGVFAVAWVWAALRSAKRPAAVQQNAPATT